MACGKTTICLLTILATLHLIWGQEGSGNEPQHSGPPNSENHDGHVERESMSFPGVPGGLGSFPFASMFSSGGSSGPEGISGSDGMSGSQMPNFGSNPFSNFASIFAPREEQLSESRLSPDVTASEYAGDDHPEPQNRFFFSLLSSRVTNCNFTTQAGSRCLSCRQALTCRSNNVGILRTCKFLHPYCNNGRCSIFPGSACFSTSAPVTSATESTTVTVG